MTSTTDMFHDPRFYRETVVDIDAAVIGISRGQWRALDATEATPEQAQALMRSDRFDVLPLLSNRAVREYYRTVAWGDYNNIERRRVQREDLLPQHTHIRDLIKSLATTERHFYFLSYEHHIVGLLTIADLNCRQVKTYLFSLLSELEIRLGEFITSRVVEHSLFEHTLASGKEKYSAVKARFDADRSRGLDAPLIEYLYLADMLNIVVKFKLYEQLEFESRRKFEERCNPLNALRHEVAHPTRSLVTDNTSVKKLWRDIDHIEDLIFRLRQTQVD